MSLNKYSPADFNIAYQKYSGDHSGQLRPGQIRVLNHLHNEQHQNFWWSMRTGGGKSWAIWMWAMLKDQLCVITEPTKAVMNNHIAKLQQLGLPAAAIHSGNTTEERQSAEDALINGKLKILYCAPELLRTRWIVNRLMDQGDHFGGIAIDEVHEAYINFRRSAYGQLLPLVNMIRQDRKTLFQLIGCSATLTPHCLEELGLMFNYSDWVVDQESNLNRPELSYQIGQFKNSHEKLNYLQPKLDAHSKKGESALIYATTKNEVEKLADHLGGTAYHGGLEDDTRQRIETDFIKNKIRRVISTEALGMGFDKPDIHAVYDWNAPRTLLNWWQHAGRAVRDSEIQKQYQEQDKKGHCEMLCSPEDFQIHQQLININFEDINSAFVKKVYEALIKNLNGDPYANHNEDKEFILNKAGFYYDLTKKTPKNLKWEKSRQIDTVVNMLIRRGQLDFKGVQDKKRQQHHVRFDPIEKGQLCASVNRMIAERYEMEVALTAQMQAFIHNTFALEADYCDLPKRHFEISESHILKHLNERPNLDEFNWG